jgi:hypothetical protein
MNRIFPKFNKHTKCPICGTTDDKPAILLQIDGTEDDGLVECMQVHLDCVGNLGLRVKPNFDNENALVYGMFSHVGADT